MSIKQAPKIWGISGVATSGKDTLFNALKMVLGCEPHNLIVRVSIADTIKAEMQKFLVDNFGIDPLNCTAEEKELIRPLLIAYGTVKRNQTEGRYLLEKTEDQINYLLAKYPGITHFIITDIRYEEFFEVEWLKDILGGRLIHLSRVDSNNNLIEPNNEDEKRNDPMLYLKADVRVTWETKDIPQYHHQIAKAVIDRLSNID